MENIIISFILVGTLAVAYLLPLFVASSRKHRQTGFIAILNLFLGWTGLVWIICLAWACGDTGRES